jgi:hypothetical protein
MVSVCFDATKWGGVRAATATYPKRDGWRGCKVRNERQLSKKLKSSNAEKERTKRMEDK